MKRSKLNDENPEIQVLVELSVSYTKRVGRVRWECVSSGDYLGIYFQRRVSK